MSTGAFRVCRMTAEHLGGVAALELLCFPHDPWGEQSLSCLCQDNGVGFVILETDGTVSAYAGMNYAAGEGSITDVACHPDYRRGGRAAAALAALIDFAAKADLESIYLEVRPSNTPAIALYERHGFVTVGCRKRFYREPVEDALIMRACVNTAR